MWYQHLAGNGFTDIEKGQNLRIAQNSHFIRKDMQTEDQFEAKVSYFNWATQMLEIGNFRTEKDRTIWEYHADNISRRKISDRIGLDDRWISRKITYIRDYLRRTTASQCAMYG